MSGNSHKNNNNNNNSRQRRPSKITTTTTTVAGEERPTAAAQHGGGAAAASPPSRRETTATHHRCNNNNNKNQHHHQQQHAAVVASSLTAAPCSSEISSSSTSVNHPRKAQRRHHRLRRKTVQALNEHSMLEASKRDDVRMAGHVAADRILFRVSRQFLENNNSGGGREGGGMQLSAAAITAAVVASSTGGSGGDGFYSVVPSSASSCSSNQSFAGAGETPSSSSLTSLDASERAAIRRGRRRGAREANEIADNNNSSSFTSNSSSLPFGRRKRNIHKASSNGGSLSSSAEAAGGQHPSTSSSLLASRGSSALNRSYISPFDLTTIAEHQQQDLTTQQAAAIAMTVASHQQHSKHSASASTRSSRSWFSGGKSKNKQKSVVSAKQAAALVAGWPTKGRLPQVLQVDQDPHERRDFYDHLNKGGGGGFLSGNHNNNSSSNQSGQHGGHPGDGSSRSTSGCTGDAWMCGVCGKAFSTFEAAERHENLHIAKVVDQLGFCAAATASPPTAATTTSTTSNGANNMSNSIGPSGRSIRTSFHSQHAAQQEQQPLAAPLTASNVAAQVNQPGNAASNTNGRAPYTESMEHYKSARQVLESETEQAHNSNSNNNTYTVDDSARRVNNDIANQRRRGQAWVVHVDDENYDIGHDKKPAAAASTRNGIYHNHVRDSLGFGVNHHDGFLVPRPRDAAAFAAGAAPPSTPLPSSMKQPSSQQQQQQETQQQGRQNRSSEVRFAERSERSLPLQDDPLATIDTPHQRNVNKNINNTGDDFQDDPQTEQQALVLSSAMQDYATLADEALVTVCQKARPLILTRHEFQAELELAYLASDKLYYDQMAERALARIVHPYSSRLRSEGEDIMAKVQNKFVDAYQLCKEGDNKKGFTDQYRKKHKDGSTNVMAMEHTNKTLYLNVIVKNSIQVVRHELERLAKERWESDAEIEKYSRFERFRVYAHVNIVRLAGIALASDFTPRRIAVQLSNDLYRLLTPRLKRRGVTISTEIEYRVGPYFVLAVNINTVRWQKLIKSTYRDVAARKAKWIAERQPPSPEEEVEEAKKNRFVRTKDYLRQMFCLTRYEILAQCFAWLYELHWIVYQPICMVLYYTFLGSTIRHFIISSVADEIFYYVEEKGMEMEIDIRQAATQAAFMLSALREIRADGQELKKKRQQSELHERGVVLGPLLGPAIKADKDPAIEPPGFELPPNLEFIGLELDLPVGFRRLRWAILSNSSTFMTEALWRTEAKYDNITMEPWNKCDEYIGVPNLPATVKEADFVGAEKVASYLMPKSAFVGANMCTETSYIIAYNDYCFCVKKKAATPGVPYGSTFFAWTQLLVVNTGNDTCRLSCSVEPEFPNGPPMVSRQITSGMRAGVGELFVKIGETITKYADEYP